MRGTKTHSHAPHVPPDPYPCITRDLVSPTEQEHANEQQQHCLEAEDMAEAEMPELVADSDDDKEEEEAGKRP